MEIALLSKNCLKVRGKSSSFIINPSSDISKTEADGVLSFDASGSIDTSKISEFRVIISGPGEYEIIGVKISAIKSADSLIYRLIVDKMSVIVGRASAISPSLENIEPAHIAIVEADILPSDKTATAIQPNIVILYGEKATEAAKLLKEGTGSASVNKFSVTFEKLPQDLEVVMLS